MTYITEDKHAAPAIGAEIEKQDNMIVVTLTENAAQSYFHPHSNATLGEILDKLCWRWTNYSEV